MLRAVVDPGVLIAGFISSRGAPRQLLYLWLEGFFELVVSPRLLDEIQRVLLRPKFRQYVTERDAVEYVRLLKGFGSLTSDPETIIRMAPDPEDDYLFALVEASGARFLVSGDRALLEARPGRSQVITPRAFVEMLQRHVSLGGW